MMSYARSSWPILNRLRARARAAGLSGPTRAVHPERAFPLITAIRWRMGARLAGQAQPPLAEQPRRTKEQPYYSFGVPWRPAEVAIGPPGWRIERPTPFASRDISGANIIALGNTL